MRRVQTNVSSKRIICFVGTGHDAFETKVFLRSSKANACLLSLILIAFCLSPASSAQTFEARLSDLEMRAGLDELAKEIDAAMLMNLQPLSEKMLNNVDLMRAKVIRELTSF